MSLVAPTARTVGRIAWQLPVSLGLAALVLATTGPAPAAIPGVALATVAPELARIDLREHRLPNRMTLSALAVSVVGVAASGFTGGPWVVPALTAAVYGGGMLVLSLVGGVGMGDAKLAGVIGLASPTAITAVGAPIAGLLLGGIAGTVVLVRIGPRHRLPLGPFLVAGWAAALVAAASLR